MLRRIPGFTTVIFLAAPLAAGAQGGDEALWRAQLVAGQTAFETGRYAEAEESWRAALREAEKFGPDDPHLFHPLKQLGQLYYVQERYAEAEPLLRRASGIRENVLGPQDRDVAESLNNLGEVLRAQGKLVEAELLHRRALTIREDVLGPEHRDVAQSLANLAAI